MPVIYQKYITREDLQANPDLTYVFGDNLIKKGFGGQAREMRGEPNAVGIPTKKAPSLKSWAFFTDEEFGENAAAIDKALSVIESRLLQGRTIVFPLDGIGTGLAHLNEKAPDTFEYLKRRLTDVLQTN